MQILRVRKYLSEVLLDQLPFLVDIQRYMDELSITDVPEPAGAGTGIFMFQQVSVMREGILKDRDWPAIADEQVSRVFTMTDKDDADLRRMADLYADDAVGDVIEPVHVAGEGQSADDDLEEISGSLRSG
jgi:hypothetical protein